MKILFGLMLVLAGCQVAEEAAPAEALLLYLQLPQTLAEGAPRRERFLQSVEYLVVRVETKEKAEEFVFPKDRWDRIYVPQQSQGDKFVVSVYVWDRKRNGEPRPYAALSGKKRVEVNSTTTVRIPLRLQVSIHEYD